MSTAPEFRLKQGDRFPKMRLQLADSAGTVIDLTGCTPSIRIRPRGGGAALVPPTLTGVVTVVGAATAGVVEYAWGVAEPLPAGVYDVEVPVTFPGGQVETVPTSGYVTLVVEPALA